MIDFETKVLSLVRCNLYPENVASHVSEDTARKGAVHGKLYTVDELEVGSSYSTVYLMEFPGQLFNPLCFENYEDVYDNKS